MVKLEPRPCELAMHSPGALNHGAHAGESWLYWPSSDRRQDMIGFRHFGKLSNCSAIETITKVIRQWWRLGFPIP